MSDQMESRRKGRRVLPEEYLGRVRMNLDYVVQIYGMSNVQRWTGISRQGIDLLLKGKRVPSIETFALLAVYLDIPPELWFLPNAAFAKRWNPEESEPFFAPARSTVSRRSLSDSGVAADRSRFHQPAKKGKASQEDVSNPRFPQPAVDLRERLRAREETSLQRQESAHAGRPAGLLIRLPETSGPRKQVA